MMTCSRRRVKARGGSSHISTKLLGACLALVAAWIGLGGFEVLGAGIPTGAGSTLLALTDVDGILGLDLVLWSRTPSELFTAAYTAKEGKAPPAVASVSVLCGVGDGSFWLASETLLYHEVEIVVKDETGWKYQRQVAAGVQAVAGAVLDLTGGGKPTFALADGMISQIFAFSDVPSGLADPPLVNLSLLNEARLNQSGDLSDATFKSSISSIAGGDLDGDGKDDLGVTSADDRGGYVLTLYHNRGDGTFEPLQPTHEWAVGAPGYEPSFVLVADANGDGKQDVIVANGGILSSEVRVLLGNGDGTFYPSEAITYVATNRPRSFLLADFTNDRKPDLIVAGIDSLVFLAGTGEDTPLFSGKKRVGDLKVPAEETGSPVGLAAADFNGDGKLDLAVANTGFDRVDVYLANGDGSFQKPVPYLSGKGLHPLSLLTGDVDGNGYADLVVSGIASNSVSVLVNDGGGGFRDVEANASPGPAVLVAGMIDSSEGLDLLSSQALCAQPSVEVVPQSGPSILAGLLTERVVMRFEALCEPRAGFTLLSGAFGAAPPPPVLLPPPPLASRDLEHVFVRALYSTDLTGDGVDETVVLWRGSHGISIGSAYSGSPSPWISSWSMLRGGLSPSACAFADFDGDTTVDIAVANSSSNNVSIYLNSGFGQFRESGPRPQVGESPNSLAAGDYNRDGKADLAICNSDSVSILAGKGDGSFLAEERLPAAVERPTSLVAGNFDGKNGTDVAFVSAASGQIYVLLSAATGFGEPVPVGVGSFATSIAAVDYDKDGALDLLAAARGSGLLFFKGDGAGGFAQPVAINEGRDLAGVVGPIGQVRAIAAREGDVAVLGDARPESAAPQGLPHDLFVVSTTISTCPPICLLPICPPDCPPPTQVQDVASGDFDHDGVSDLALLGTSRNGNGSVQTMMEIWRGSRGTSSAFVNGSEFVKGSATQVDASGSLLAAGDIDGDGLLDLAVVSTSTNTVTPLWGKGDGTFGMGDRVSTTVVAPSLVQVIEGQGLVIGSMQELEILARAPDNPRSFGSIHLNVEGLVVAIACGDLNRDGVQDLIVATVDTPAVVVFSGNDLKNLPDGAADVKPSASTPIHSAPTALAAGSFDGSGLAQVLVASGDKGELQVVKGFDDGAVVIVDGLSMGRRPLLVASGDFNGDLREDVAVVANRPLDVSFLYGTPDGSLVEVARSLLPLAEAPTKVVAGDWNGDGKTDLLAIRRGADSVSIFWNSVTAPRGLTLGNLKLKHATFLPQNTTAAAVPPVVPTAPLAVLASTAADVAASKQLGFVYRGRSWASTGDVNGDGMVDVVLACADTKTLSVLLGTGLRERPLLWGSTVDLEGAPQGPAVLADLDGDGLVEVAVAIPSQNEVALFDDLGQGQLVVQVRVPTGVVPVSVSAGHFGGDDTADLAVLCQGSREVLVFDGHSLWMKEPQPIRLPFPGTPGRLAVADLNSDRIDDLVTTDLLAPQIVLYLSNQGPAGLSFSPRALADLPTGVADVVLAGDLDLDRTVDLVVAGVGTECALVLLNGDYGQFAAGSREIVGSHPRDAVLCDLDQDGVLDLATVERGSGLVLAYHNAGAASFAQQPANYVSLVEDDPWDLASGDFDLDGKIDVFVTAASGRLGIIWGQGGGFLLDEECAAVRVEE
jgi:hypothetical protein